MISAVVSAVGLVIAAVSATIALIEVRQNHQWSRRKASEETLSKLVIGDFPDTLERLILEFGWDPVNSSINYDDVAKKLNEQQKLLLDLLLRRLLRILEALCIHIKHGILDEDICYDYLASMLTNLYLRCGHFIENERFARKDQRVFENFSKYAHDWDRRNSQVKGTYARLTSIPPKRGFP